MKRPPVFDWGRVSAPLEGRMVRLEPITPDHEPGLWEAAQDRRIWAAANLRIETRDHFGRWMENALDEQAGRVAAPFATIDAVSRRVLGSTRYGSLRPEHRSLEIGWTWLTPTAWGTGANVEAKLLMLTRAFEELGCIRVEFKTNARNDRSRGALGALPAQFEGVHRKHMIVQDGELRDSAWYSVVDDEWPRVKANLMRRVAALEEASLASARRRDRLHVELALRAPIGSLGVPRPSADLIRAVPLFAGLDDRSIERLAGEFIERSFEPGQEIASEGEGGLNFFVVDSGKANVAVKGKDVGTLTAGDSFGEIALVDKSARTATVTATTPMRCYALPVWSFRPFVAEHPDVSWNLLELLAERLRTAEGR